MNVKIRGGKRRNRVITQWRQEYIPNFKIDLSDSFNDYELVIEPFPLPFSNRSPLKFRNELFAGLLDLYDACERQLRLSETPYFLSIILYEMLFWRSRVYWTSDVERMELTWQRATAKMNENLTFPANRFHLFADRLVNFQWICTPFEGERSILSGSDGSTWKETILKTDQEREWSGRKICLADEIK